MLFKIWSIKLNGNLGVSSQKEGDTVMKRKNKLAKISPPRTAREILRPSIKKGKSLGNSTCTTSCSGGP